ncbi:MAG: serine hydrolase domain-containing protein [Isosphaeraceae bacterium]
MTRTTAVPLTLLLSILAAVARGDEASDRVDASLASWDRRDSPGAAVTVVKDGRIVYAKGVGMADLEHDVPITPRTPFFIASVTKQFTAYAITRLAAEGRLSLDDDVRRHLPELADFGREVTVRHLLHHTSGLRDYGSLLVLAGGQDGDMVRRDEVFRLLFGQRELNFDPGAEHEYCNSNYVLLAKIVERTSGLDYGNWLAAHVFGPLGMTSSGLGADPGRIIKGRAFSYGPRDGGRGYRALRWPSTTYGEGNLYASAEDLARWFRFLGRARSGDRDGDILNQMERPGRLKDGTPIPYALGLVAREHGGERVVGHSGAWEGYRAYAGLFPDRDLGVVVLSNDESFDAEGTAMKVADAYLGRRASPPGLARPAEAATAPRPESHGPITADPSAYRGRYTSAELGMTYEVVMHRASIAIRIPRLADLPLEPAGADHFAGYPLEGARADYQFDRGQSGRVRGLRVSFLGVRNLRFDRHVP